MNKIKKTFAMALALTVLLLNPINQSFAHDEQGLEQLNASQVRGLARQHLDTLGFSRLGTSQSTALVGDAKLVDATWVVNVDFGGRFANKTGVLYVDNATGAIIQSTN